MPVAAVPNYLRQDFGAASPGMRFGMYLKLWGINRRTKSLLWTTHDIDYEVRGPQRREREVERENKVSALTDAKRLNENDKKSMRALLERQRHAFDLSASEEGTICLDVVATAPFTTGLGNEHPLENGFAFLWPYGLPYLPGSGVKGVLRQAARELAWNEWGDSKGWSEEKAYRLRVGGNPVLDLEKQPVTVSMLDVLFGRETLSGESDHVRGALSFWDVVPQIEGDSLMVEIMTPHQGHYYQIDKKKNPEKPHFQSPHESGQPTPISFLTVPPGSRFVFHVVCDLALLGRLAPDLARDGRWKVLVQEAFMHAFDWLGFGAKTAVGYGAMKRDEAREAEERKKQEARARAAQEAAEAARRAKEKEAERAKMDPVERSIHEFLDNRPDKNQPEISAVIGAVKQGRWQGEEKVAVARWLKSRMQASKGEWKETSQAKRPDRDREHQNTLLVLDWLEGK